MTLLFPTIDLYTALGICAGSFVFGALVGFAARRGDDDQA